MSSKRNITSQHGLALLETAALLGVVVVLLTVVVAMIEYCRALWAVRAIVDRYVYDQAAKPLIIRIDGDQGISVQVNEDAIEKAVDEINQKIAEEIGGTLQTWNLSAQAPFYVETAYSQLNINTNSGRSDGLNSPAGSYTQEFGDLSVVKPALDKEVTLRERFEDAANKKIPDPEDPNRLSALYAVASAPVIGGRGDNAYLPYTVLIGARVGVSFTETWIGKFCEIVGIDPFVSGSKVVGLRGEIGT